MLQTTIHRSGLVLVLAGSLGWVALAEQSDVHAIADKVDQRYNHMQTLQAEFAETYSGAGIKRTESGTLELKKPGRMRWDYTEPRPKMFVTDGATAWFYVPGERQARRAPVKQIEDLRSPLRYLLGKTKLEKELQNLSFAPDVPVSAQGNAVLRGVPKGLQDRINQVLVESTPDHQICRIVLEEVDGATTEYRFQKMEENAAVGDDHFDFTPPPGVETVTGDVGQ